MPKNKPFHAKKNNGTNNNNFIEKVKPNTITCEAQVIEVLPDTHFKVLLKDVDSTAIVTLSGKMRINYIKILKGDWVTVELSTYDLTKGRITYRHKNFNYKNNNNKNQH